MKYRIVEHPTGYTIQVQVEEISVIPFRKKKKEWVRADKNGRPLRHGPSAAAYMMRYLEDFEDLPSALEMVEKFKKGIVIHEC